MTKIVALGGGHGLSMLLSCLAPTEAELTAIVSVADDGGSSGRLRHDLDIVAPGDVRACLSALAKPSESRNSETLLKLFNYRFDKGELDGHSMGNLMLVALARELGTFEAAVQHISELLQVKGKVMPATESSVVLCAQTAHGFVRGQVQIEQCSEIERVFLDPDTATPLAGVVDEILHADHIMYAPGSLFTSVIPSFIISDIAHAISVASAPVTMVMNLVNKGPDTDGMTGDDHLTKVILHGGRVDRVICDIHSLRVEEPPVGVDVISAAVSGGQETHDIEALRKVLSEFIEFS
jgi:uncharacterized cofD-like protein